MRWKCPKNHKFTTLCFGRIQGKNSATVLPVLVCWPLYKGSCELFLPVSSISVLPKSAQKCSSLVDLAYRKSQKNFQVRTSYILDLRVFGSYESFWATIELQLTFLKAFCKKKFSIDRKRLAFQMLWKSAPLHNRLFLHSFSPSF